MATRRLEQPLLAVLLCTCACGSKGSGVTADAPIADASAASDRAQLVDRPVSIVDQALADRVPTDLAAADQAPGVDQSPPADRSLPDTGGAKPEAFSGCPTGMVIATAAGGSPFCIDATEVSYGQYGAFYSANPPTSSQPAGCAWNVSWTPAAQWPQPPSNSNNPVAYVNWCQADGYCRYEGRHLCGRVGGGPVAQASFADPAVDQWFSACSAQGTNCPATPGAGCYPYGGAFNSTLCNGAGSGAESFQLLLSCEGGAPGLLEMSGNVAEWEDSCSATSGATDGCAVRGGSYLDNAAGLRCDSGSTTGPVTQPRNYAGPDVGFRCCL
jgi:hypothetical protein